jgi:hypothetical protein
LGIAKLNVEIGGAALLGLSRLARVPIPSKENNAVKRITTAPIVLPSTFRPSSALISGTVRKVASLLSKRLGGMGERAKAGASEQGANCGKPSVAGARAIFPLVLQVVEEGTDQGASLSIGLVLTSGFTGDCTLGNLA